MTNDKAISLLRAMQEPGPWDPQITEPAFEALEMAIEALEHTGDCILEQFGECSYIETGCGDCKVKRRISEVLKYNDKYSHTLPSMGTERKKGKWIKIPGFFTPGGDPVWACSECGKGVHVYGIEHRSYQADISDDQWKACPNCGAEMTGENNG